MHVNHGEGERGGIFDKVPSDSWHSRVENHVTLWLGGFSGPQGFCSCILPLPPPPLLITTHLIPEASLSGGTLLTVHTQLAGAFAFSLSGLTRHCVRISFSLLGIL